MKPIALESEQAFREQVLGAGRPALVMFYKTGCPTCLMLLPGLAKLAREYDGRATIAEYRHLSALFQAKSKELMQEYRVHLVPTVILFVDGQERKRWFMEYRLSRYRKALDKALAGQPVEPDEAATGAGAARPETSG